MPDFWSHHFAALKADENRKLVKPSRLIWSEAFDNLYAFGAQGPDFFYYIGKFKPLSKHHFGDIGNQMHERGVQDLFRDMLNYMIGNPSEALMAYVSGFISHYILDVHCHPLICSLGPDSATHKRVELDLEAFCLRDYWGYDKQRLDVGTIKCATSQLLEGFINLWQYLLLKNYGVTIDDDALTNGHNSMLRLQKMIVNDTIGKLPFIDFLSKCFHYDLSSLRYPAEDDRALKSLREYDTFIKNYTLGIDETTKALIALDEVLIGTVSVEQYIETFIKFDFLGEA